MIQTKRSREGQRCYSHAIVLRRNPRATDADEWLNTAQMVNCHLNVKISGSKAETIISLTSLKDPRAPIRLTSKPSFHGFGLTKSFKVALASQSVKYFTDYHFVTDLTFLM